VQLRDRNSMLSVPGRSFRKVLTILAQAQHEQQRAVKAQRSAAPKVGPAGAWCVGVWVCNSSCSKLLTMGSGGLGKALLSARLLLVFPW
jgi:hypothetical protein